MTDDAAAIDQQAGLPGALTWLVLGCVAAACVLYLWRLQDTPAAIGGDEAFFANHGLSIARTGADLNGRHWPLVIQLDPNVDPGLWYQAMLVYLEAIAFTMLPFAEWSARLPVALLAIVNIVLAWQVAARYTRHPSAGPIAAMVTALSPIYFFLSRQVVDYICPIFFVLLWLRALIALDERGRPRDAFMCGLILAAGIFSYVSSWLMMPVYLLCTIAFCLSKPRRWTLSLAAVAGFSVPAGALVLWLAAHPDAWNSVFHRYAGQSMQLPRFNMNGAARRPADRAARSRLVWHAGRDSTAARAGAVCRDRRRLRRGVLVDAARRVRADAGRRGDRRKPARFCHRGARCLYRARGLRHAV